MMKLTTEVTVEKLGKKLKLNDKIVVLGSCFADSMGVRLADAGFDVMINPFGTLYNPESIFFAVERLNSCNEFCAEDCVKMGAGSGLYCSYFHHTSFARDTVAEFLDNANRHLEAASEFWQDANKVIVTYGTATVWQKDEITVANCLKRPAKEFTRKTLSLFETMAPIKLLAELNPDKEFIFTVSPIRHLNPDGAHANTISKARLQVALEEAVTSLNNASYFPAYEIMMDELRDYRFYAEDLVHPNAVAENIIWERFLDAATKPEERQTIEENLRKSRSSRHIENGRRWMKD